MVQSKPKYDLGKSLKKGRSGGLLGALIGAIVAGAIVQNNPDLTGNQEAFTALIGGLATGLLNAIGMIFNDWRKHRN